MKNFFFSFMPFLVFTVFGNSMTPTFRAGEKILVQKKWFFCHIGIGNIVVCKDPRNKKKILKRIKKIKEEKYYVLGDNEKESTDSRQFGWINKKNIIGRVIFSQNM